MAQLALAEIHFDLAGNPEDDEEDLYKDHRDFQYAAYWYDRFLSQKKLSRSIEEILWDENEITEIIDDLESPKLIFQNKKIIKKSKISKKPNLKIIKK